MNADTSLLPAPVRLPVWRHAGFWMASLLALMMLLNAARTFIDPAAFSAYMGLPADDATALAWVKVYGIRALFIGLLAAWLLARRDAGTLQVLSLLALVMPLGDAWLVYAAGGGTVWRHLLTATVLLIAAVTLGAWRRADAAKRTPQ